MIVINNRIIDSDISAIVKKIQEETNFEFLKDVKETGNSLMVTCPFHAEHSEKHPSCGINNDKHSDLYGVFHCFTCGASGNLQQFVSQCLGLNVLETNEWLIDNCSDIFGERDLYLEEISLNNMENKEFLDDSILEEYKYIHPYAIKRGLTEEVIKKFTIGYNHKTDSITFPVWDDKGRLVGITERLVYGKYFYIPKGMEKPVYLLNFIKDENIDEVYVTESQIDALTCWSWGLPAIALLGTGIKSQYEILRKSGIRKYHLAFDGDLAGFKGMLRFLYNMPNDVLIDIIELPKGKDVNNLNKCEFLALDKVDQSKYVVRR